MTLKRDEGESFTLGDCFIKCDYKSGWYGRDYIRAAPRLSKLREVY